MTKRWKSRARRRKLKAHDRGENRHSKSVSWLRKTQHFRANVR